MKIRVTFDVDDECRMAIAREVDGREYDGKRKATRDEVIGKIMDGAEDSLTTVVAYYDQLKQAEATTPLESGQKGTPSDSCT